MPASKSIASNIGLKALLKAMLLSCALVSSVPLSAATGGSISGTVVDPGGAVVASAKLSLVNTAQHIDYQTTSDAKGLWSFPNLPVGQYNLTIMAAGFTPQHRMELRVDTDSALRVDAVLSIGTRSDTVTVSSGSGVEVDAIATHLGEVIPRTEMTTLPLNGRSYTDLLAVQPGVTPVSTLLPSSVIMAGVTGSLDPSGDLNPGNLSINGQRESSNGFMVNGIDVQEHMNGGSSIIPNLDSIEEFRVLSNNFDPEYGNYNGGMVTVVSRSGGNVFHGNAFEFFRNTALDARGYFDPVRSTFRQNQFGGTLGGPVMRDSAYFFADYQGTRTNQGVSTGNISVPTMAERDGAFSDLIGSVSGPYLASLLTQELGESVTAGDFTPAYFPAESSLSARGRGPEKTCCNTSRRPMSVRASIRAQRSRRQFAMTKARYELTRIASQASYRLITSWITTGSTIPIPDRWQAQGSRASTRSSSARHS